SVNRFLLNDTPDLPEHEIRAYSRSTIIEQSLPLSDWAAIISEFLKVPIKYSMFGMECYGGQINAVAEDYNAFIHRSSKMNLFCHSFFEPNLANGAETIPDATVSDTWLESFFKFLAPFGNGHSYQNYPKRRQ